MFKAQNNCCSVGECSIGVYQHAKRASHAFNIPIAMLSWVFPRESPK